MNYFDSAIGNDILLVGLHYQIGGLQKLRGKCVNFLCKLNTFMLANSSMKDDKFANESNESNVTINELLNGVLSS